MNIFVTGSSGFIGANFCLYSDKLANVTPLDKKLSVFGVPTFSINFTHESSIYKLEKLIEVKKPEFIFHFAAESHVDNSISSPLNFLDNNVTGTVHILEALRRAKYKKTTLIFISTDEVYGDLPIGPYHSGELDAFMEHDPFHPNSPYSASKAAAEMFCHAYGRTWQIPYKITRTCNNYGPYQQLDKFLPKVITKILKGEKVPVYGTGLNEREWIYVEDNCRAIWTVAEKGIVGEAYNIGSNVLMNNNRLVQEVVHHITPGSKLEDVIEYVKDRPGHDLKYKVESAKIRELGWRPQVTFGEGLARTIQWYKDNRGLWWDEKKSRNNTVSGEKH